VRLYSFIVVLTLLLTLSSYWPSPSSRSLTQALALGLGSLFNHSTLHQNIGWRRDLAIDCIVYTALRDIDEGEELCISYGSGRLWFPDADELAGGGTDAVMRDRADQDEDDCRAGTLGELELSGLNGIGIGIDAEEEKENAVDDGKAREDLRRESKP
jgi:SET domain